jgi:hypothetical protein
MNSHFALIYIMGNNSLLLLEKSCSLFDDFCEGYFTGRVQHLRNSCFLFREGQQQLSVRCLKLQAFRYNYQGLFGMSAPILARAKNGNLTACPKISGGYFLRAYKYISHIVTIQGYHIEQA